MVSAAPFHERYIDPTIHLIMDLIRGIPRLYNPYKYNDIELANLQVHLGRSTTKALRSRYDSAFRHGHVGAAVVCRFEPEDVDKIEVAGMRIISALKRRGSLCVGNVNILNALAGTYADHEDGAIVYMTWGPLLDEPQFTTKLSTSIIRSVAVEVSDSMQNIFDGVDIANGLSEPKALTTRLSLEIINK